MVMNYALSGYPRASTPSEFILTQEQTPGGRTTVKEMSVKKEPHRGDYNQEILGSRESFRSTFEELKLSTDGLSTLENEITSHPNFFELYRVPSTVKEKKKISGQYVRKT
jgi:hypothetical protein